MEKAKDKLKATTQDCICSALLPLTSIYCTYLTSQRLRRHSCIFCTDVLLVKNISIIGNTCAQIFMVGEVFVYIHPIRYKSQDVEALNVVTRYIGVPNILTSDNAGE